MQGRRVLPQRSIWATMLSYVLRVVLGVWVFLIVPAMPWGLIVVLGILTEGYVSWLGLAILGFCVLWYPFYRLLQWFERRHERIQETSDAAWSEPFE